MVCNDSGSVLKKTQVHPKADEKQRAAFSARIQHYKEIGKPIIYIDESGFNHTMPRLRGYSKKGQRCFDKIDWHHRLRTNVIGAILDFTFITACLFEGNINADIFHAWLVYDLLPKIPQQAVLVMDNATFHKRKDIVTKIKDHGHILEYLPPYSPDLNPIEHKWFVAKALRRKTGKTVLDIFKHYDTL